MEDLHLLLRDKLPAPRGAHYILPECSFMELQSIFFFFCLSHLESDFLGLDVPIPTVCILGNIYSVGRASSRIPRRPRGMMRNGVSDFTHFPVLTARRSR